MATLAEIRATICVKPPKTPGIRTKPAIERSLKGKAALYCWVAFGAVTYYDLTIQARRHQTDCCGMIAMCFKLPSSVVNPAGAAEQASAKSRHVFLQ